MTNRGSISSTSLHVIHSLLCVLHLLIGLKLSESFVPQSEASSRRRVNHVLGAPPDSLHVLRANQESHHNTSEAASENTSITSRRTVLKTGALISVSSLISPAVSSLAAADQDEAGMVSTTTVADRLRAVPTFTIVDAKGTPYMVVGEDAKVTGYFFTTYGEANRILTLAKTSADQNIREALIELRAQRKQEGLPPLSKQQEEDQVGINPWKVARISTVPLDVAVTLVTKSMYSKRAGGGNYFQVAPAESDVQDALALDKSGKEELAEGRVPLFYFADFEIIENDRVKHSPLYFRKSQLLDDFRKYNPKADIPQVLVTELFNVLTEMVKPGGTDTDLQSLVFIPPKESAQKAKECKKAGGKESPFLVGQRIVVL